MSPADFPITSIIIAATCIISFMAFSNGKLMDDLIFYPPSVTRDKQWYRFVTYGLIHADMQHLIFNMISFYFFGKPIEMFFDAAIPNGKGRLLYILLYTTALIVCLLPTFSKNKNNYYYRTLGASGAVSAVVFAFITLAPTVGVFLGIPGFIYGPIYLYISARLDKQGHGGINHSAHIWGSLYGVAFVLIAVTLLTDMNPVADFFTQILDWFKSFKK